MSNEVWENAFYILIERKLFTVFYKFGVVCEKDLKNIKNNAYSESVRINGMWIDNSTNARTAKRKTTANTAGKRSSTP